MSKLGPERRKCRAFLKKCKMYRVPSADINCNLGKVTHAYRSVLKGTDRVYVVISNGSSSGGQSTQIKYLSKSTDTYNKILLQ